MKNEKLSPAYLRQQIVGVDSTFETPFGERLMVYCDYTASGRCLRFVESYLQSLQRVYANTHTEDDITGRSMTQLLHEAEEAIKKSVNAGPDGRIIACGTGATGAIEKLQQIVGVALSPATRQNIGNILDESEAGFDSASFEKLLRDRHSRWCSSDLMNIIPTKFPGEQSLATTVEVRLDAAGSIDLGHFEELVAGAGVPESSMRIGSFSAASNVTGIRSDVRKISSLLHALRCDRLFRLCGVCTLRRNRHESAAAGDEDTSIDAIFVSPHKFLGGPGLKWRAGVQ